MKKVLILFLVVILAISMLLMGTSCKTTIAEETTAKAEETTAGTTSAETTSAETTAAEPITITWWDIQTAPEYKAMMEEIFALYQQTHPNVTFDRKGQAIDAYFELLKSATLAGNLPDIFGLQMSDFETFYKEGQIVDLKPFVEADPKWKEAVSIYPLDSPAVSIDNGNVLCALSSQSWHMYMLYYKDISAKYSLKDPVTVDAIMENNEILKANGITSFATGFQYAGSLADFWVAMVAQIDGDRTKVDQAEAGEISWQNETMLAATKALQKLIPSFSKDALAVDDFTDGHTRFYGEGYWGMAYAYEQMFAELSTARPDEVANDKIGISAWPMPTPDSDPEVMAGGPGSDLSVNANSPNIDAVIEFLKFYATEEASKILLKYSIPPAVKMDFDISKAATDPMFLKAMEVVNAHPKQYILMFYKNPDAYQRLIDNLTNLFAGKMTPEELLANMDELTYKK